jgi:hypothetical protein
MASENCGTCRFFLENLKEPGIGVCRANPPRTGGHPTVRARDWCGRYHLDPKKSDDQPLVEGEGEGSGRSRE